MKLKAIVLLVVFILFGSVIGQNANVVVPYILKAPAPITVDASLDEWSFACPLPMNPEVMRDYMRAVVDGWVVTDAENCSGTLYMMYDDEYFYFAADVVDDMPGHLSEADWAADAIEFYFASWDVGADALIGANEVLGWVDDAGSGDYSFQVNIQFSAADDVVKILGYNGPPANLESENTEAKYVVTDDGYILEGKIYLEDLASVTTGNIFEFTGGTRIPFAASLYDIDDTESSADFKGYTYTPSGFAGWQGISPGFQVCDVLATPRGDVWATDAQFDFVSPYIKKAAVSPTVDGVLDEWNFCFPIDFNPEVMTDGMRCVADGWVVDDAENCSGTLYMMYDDAYLYLAASVMDDMPGHFSDADWAADAIEFYLANWDMGDAIVPADEALGWIDDAGSGDYSLQLNIQFDTSEDEAKILGYNGPNADLKTENSTVAYTIWPDEDGYNLEAKILLDDMASATTGNVFEFIEGLRYPIMWSLYDMDDSENSGDFKGYAYTKAGFPGWQGISPGWQYADVKALDFIDDWEANGPYPIDTAVEDQIVIMPESFGVSSYPNPFNPVTTLQIQLESAGNVALNIYDLNGKLVETVMKDAHKSAGMHTVQVDMSAQPSGIYVAVVQQNNEKATHKMMLVK